MLLRWARLPICRGRAEVTAAVLTPSCHEMANEEDRVSRIASNDHDRPLSDIALCCSFTDQAHLCRHFRGATGQTSGAWRRARRTLDIGKAGATLSGEGALVREV